MPDPGPGTTCVNLPQQNQDGVAVMFGDGEHWSMVDGGTEGQIPMVGANNQLVFVNPQVLCEMCNEMRKMMAADKKLSAHEAARLAFRKVVSKFNDHKEETSNGKKQNKSRTSKSNEGDAKKGKRKTQKGKL